MLGQPSAPSGSFCPVQEYPGGCVRQEGLALWSSAGTEKAGQAGEMGIGGSGAWLKAEVGKREEGEEENQEISQSEEDSFETSQTEEESGETSGGDEESRGEDGEEDGRRGGVLGGAGGSGVEGEEKKLAEETGGKDRGEEESKGEGDVDGDGHAFASSSLLSSSSSSPPPPPLAQP